MGHEQIHIILSWEVRATDYESTDKQKGNDRREITGATPAMNRIHTHKRVLQVYVRDNLDHYGFVDINKRMFYP
uniref:Uncharacterized protein n=1 Tax=Oryza punctata TaxID=4537 RepID=A0A0E0MFQ9_ORYPU